MTRDRTLQAAFLLGVLGTALLVLVYPLTRADYPPITDLPFHAATASILRHYGDPAYAFAPQFTFAPFAVPYWTFLALGAAFAFVLPIAASMKLAMCLMLATIPAGLAVLCHGMKKSPFIGLAGLVLVWTSLTYWGFINFIAALGLFCMVLGVTFLVLDAPTFRRQFLLAILLVLVLETHVFRYPFAIAAVLLATAALFPATRRWKPVILPLVPSLLLFGIWLVVRDRQATGLETLALAGPDWERLGGIGAYLFGSLTGGEEQRRAAASALACAALLGCNVVGFVLERRWRNWSPPDRAFHLGTHATVACSSLLFAAGYLTLPMKVGTWWGVFPREALAALLVALALIPNRPRRAWVQGIALAAVAWAASRQALLTAAAFTQFQTSSADFRAVAARIPMAPRLGYMIFDPDDPAYEFSPYVHFPAWVQAEKGGWLSFHFVSNNQSPIRYRRNSAAVPPPTPFDFEWNPQRFDLRSRGAFFDTFLVRSQRSPAAFFAADPSLELVDQQGTWWLYRRRPR